MRIRDTGKAASVSATLPELALDAELSVPANRRPRARSVSTPGARARASRGSSPDTAPLLAGAEESQADFNKLPLDVLYKIRAALAPNDAARMAETSKSMLAIFQPRADADHLRHQARHPPAGILTVNGGRPVQLVNHFIHLMNEAGRQGLPEDLLPPVLHEIMQRASQQIAPDGLHIEHVAHAYLLQVEAISDRQCKRALLCDFGRLLEMPRFRTQCVSPRAPDTPRPTVLALANRFGMLCVTLNAESTGSAPFHESAASSAGAADGMRGARGPSQHISGKQLTDRVAVNAALITGVFMLPVPQRQHVWALLDLECAYCPVHVRLPLLRALVAMAASLGTTVACKEAILRSVEGMQDQDAATRAMLLEHLGAALQASPDRDLKNWGTTLLLAEANRLAPQFRPDLLVPLIRTIPSIPAREKKHAFDIVLSKVFELTHLDQRRILTVLYQAMRHIPLGAERLAAFDQMWQVLPDADPRFAPGLRNEMIHQIRNLPAHVRPERFFEAVSEAEKLSGHALSDVLPYLLSNLATLGPPTVASTGFCEIAAMLRRQPIAVQTSELRTLYDFVGRVSEPELACAFLTLLDRTAAKLDDLERVFLIGTAAARTAWLPEPMFSDQLGSRVAQAKALAPPMCDMASTQIVQALRNVLEAPNVRKNPVLDERLETIVSNIGTLPLTMRVPLLVTATRVLEGMRACPERDRMGDMIVKDVAELPSAARMQLRESLAAANCRHLFGYL